MDAQFCTSCGASIKESPEEDPFDLSTWKGRIRFAGGLVALAAFVIVGVGVFWYAISSWGWILGIAGGIIIILCRLRSK
jgi:hypothetical protein